MDFHARLVVRRRRIRLDLARRDRGVARNLHGHHAAERLDAQRERRHIQQQDVLYVARENRALNRRAYGDDFVWVYALVGFFPAEEVAHQRLHLGDARRAAHQNHFLDVIGRHLRVFQRLLHRLHRAFQQIVHHLLEPRAGELLLHVNRPAGARGDERQVDLRLHHLRELDLGFFGCVLQPLQRHLVLAQVDVVLFLELVDQPVHDSLIDVIAAQVCIAVGGLHFHDARADFQYGNVERAAAQVVHRDRFVALLIQPIRQRRRGRLVDDANHFEAGNFACLFRGLPLRVVEVRRDSDYGLRDLLTEKIFRGSS